MDNNNDIPDSEISDDEIHNELEKQECKYFAIDINSEIDKKSA